MLLGITFLLGSMGMALSSFVTLGLLPILVQGIMAAVAPLVQAITGALQV